MKKLGLALGAGAARGVSHIGFLKALDEEGIKPDMIAGCSMGSVVGAAYASGMSFEGMQASVNNLRLLDLITPAGVRGGLFGTKKMRKTIENAIGALDFADLKIPFCCVATDIISRQVVVFNKGSVVDAVVASSCIPLLFSPVVMGEMRLVDGYVLDRVPFRQVKDMGADVVVAVDALGKNPLSADDPVTLQMALEVIDILEGEHMERKKAENADMIDLWLEPDLGEMSQFDIRKVDFAFEQGYALGKANVSEIKKLLD